MRGNWRTPDDFWEVINGEFDFQMDADNNASASRCAYCVPEGMDALQYPWISSVWCNPPYNDLSPWVNKAIQESQAGHNDVVCLLTLLSTAKWAMRAADQAAETRIITPRIQFEPPEGITKSSNRTDNMLFVFRKGKQGQNVRFWSWK